MDRQAHKLELIGTFFLKFCFENMPKTNVRANERYLRFKQFNQQDATILQVYYLTFMCGSTCFGRLPAPSSGAYNCTRSRWFNRWREAARAFRGVVTPRPTTLQPPLSNGKTRSF
jgi:hypothetical protein